MKKILICVILLTISLSSILAFSEKPPKLTEIKETPIWVKEYFNNLSSNQKHIDENNLEISNIKYDIKLKVEKSDKNYNLNFYKKGKFIKTILTSKLGFDSIIWSNNGKYLSFINITAAHDIAIVCDLYIYYLNDNNKLNLIYSESKNRGTQVSFSNKNKYGAFGSKHSLILYDLETKKQKVIKIPSKLPGEVSTAIWKEDDKEIFIYYVTPAGTIQFLVSNFM